MSLVMAAIPLAGGCTQTFGFQPSIFGSSTRTEFCDSVRTFVRQPLDEEGLRRAWFLPLGIYEDGSIDFYAPMAANPHDDAALFFYDQRVGQLTHYTTAPEFGFEFSKCLTTAQGFRRLERELMDGKMRGSFIDREEGRRIEVRANDGTTAILVAEEGWDGDLAEALSFSCSAECEVEE